MHKQGILYNPKGLKYSQYGCSVDEPWKPAKKVERRGMWKSQSDHIPADWNQARGV